MKTRFLFLLVLISSYGFSQSVNDYKAVIIPVKYDFMKTDNQYRLSTLTKINLKKAGFEAYYSNETMPKEYNDRCSFLNVDVKKESGFLVTKLFVTFKDCYGTIVYQSEIGKSKEKDYEVAYTEALNNAFVSVNAIKYKYNGGITGNTALEKVTSVAVAVPVVTTSIGTSESNQIAGSTANLLYAQPTAFGFQLIDSTPKVIFKIFKTSSATCFIAFKDNNQGVLISKDNQWFFEYYQNEKLISEKVGVKF